MDIMIIVLYALKKNFPVPGETEVTQIPYRNAYMSLHLPNFAQAMALVRIDQGFLYQMNPLSILVY